MSGLQIIGSGTTIGRIEVEVAFEWKTDRPQTQLAVDGSRVLLTEDEALELARWLMQCVGNASAQRAQSEAILKRIQDATG
jgi:hypothetical protein